MLGVPAITPIQQHPDLLRKQSEHRPSRKPVTRDPNVFTFAQVLHQTLQQAEAKEVNDAITG